MYLLDTNVVSELRKVPSGKADRRVVAWVESIAASDLFISVMTVQELEIGARLLERRDAIQGGMLRTWLTERVIPSFEGRILAVDLAVVRRNAELNVPNPKPFCDGLIAATALVHRMTVVTRNVDDFAPTGVTTLNPWSD